MITGDIYYNSDTIESFTDALSHLNALMFAVSRC